MIKIRKEYYKMTEECLKNYNLIIAHVEELKNELKEIDIEDGLAAIDYSTSKVGVTNKIKRGAEETAIRNITRKDLVLKQIELYQCKLNRIKKAVDSLDERERKIIKSKYVEGKQWYIVADEENYSEKWCKKIRKTAIDRLSLVLYGEQALIENQFLEVI